MKHISECRDCGWLHCDWNGFYWVVWAAQTDRDLTLNQSIIIRHPCVYIKRKTQISSITYHHWCIWATCAVKATFLSFTQCVRDTAGSQLGHFWYWCQNKQHTPLFFLISVSWLLLPMFLFIEICWYWDHNYLHESPNVKQMLQERMAQITIYTLN